jgi:predicted regulator of Ras-like GTPase activity (Roadblock/LC7/MglB family)/DNA-binding response OmpR family regulator
MKTVLVVDDEKSFLLSLEEGLRHSADFHTITAENGKKAVEVLAHDKVDLVVTDLNMPEMDGFQLMAYMLKACPEIPVMVMTAYSTPEIKAKLESLGSFPLHEKPINLRELSKSIVASLSSMDSSHIRGITLPAFLQLITMERKTCTLKVTSRGATGFLCFMDGTLMDAQTKNTRGEEAAYDIVSWDDVEIEITSICKIKTNHIGKSLNYVLMEALRRKDERQSKAKQHAPAAASSETAFKASAPVAEVPRATADGVNGAIKEDRMAALKQVLAEFTKLAGVNAVCLVGRDGFLLDSVAQAGIDSEMVGAIASSGFGASESMGKQLGKGLMMMSMIEFENGPVMFSPVGEDSLLVIIADKDANLGMVRLKLKKHSHEIAAATAI